MDLQEIPCAPARQLPRFLVGHNPFFLLSALCMLFGIFSLNHSLTWSPLPKYNLLGLIIVLNGYEILLMLLGVFLLKRGLIRDGVTLVVLEAIFLADCGFLNSEIFTADFVFGLFVNIGLLVLAALKLAYLFRGMGLSLRRDPRYGLILLQMVFLLTAPGYFRAEVDSRGDSVLPFVLYMAWWLFALMVAVYLPMLNPTSLPHRRLIGTFIYITTVSIFAHLCMAGWVYRVEWHWANLTPLLLGLSVATGLYDHHVRHLALRMRLSLLLPIAAIVMSMENPEALAFTFNFAAITPIRAALMGAAVVYLIALIVHVHPWFAVAALICPLPIFLGKDATEMGQHVGRIIELLETTINMLTPTTLTAWGVISLIAAFVLLGLGVLSSLYKGVDPPSDG